MSELTGTASAFALTQQPALRDLEFFALRFLGIGETYLVDGQLATFLVE